jgi:hypothetical protein
VTRARIGLQPETWNGERLMVAHVIPLDGEAADADRCAKLLRGPEVLTLEPWAVGRVGRDADTYPTLCGERCRPHFADPWHIVLPTSRGIRWRACPVCAKLDRPRLPA